MPHTFLKSACRLRAPHWTLVTFCYLVLAGVVLGQGKGALRGTVEDSSGQVIVGANVKLRNQTDSQEFSTNSDEEGYFQFLGLAASQYILTAIRPGFKTRELPVNIQDRSDDQIHIKLQVAAEVESVRVSANDITMPVASQNMDSVELDRRWIENLPSKEADPLAVPSLFLSPAAAGTMGPMILVDGVEASALEVPLTSIKRIVVNKSPYSAEFARPGRGRIEVFTRKGDRRYFHANITFLVRNSVLDARNAFAQTRPPSDREIVEVELDGPLSNRVRLLLAGRYFTSDDTSVAQRQARRFRIKG